MSDSDKESTTPSTSTNRSINKTERLSKHLRRRYWTSWEEMKLVEVWRSYSDDVTSTVKHTPVFATISYGMRMAGFQVNSQECRRKIHQMKNKYITERQKIESNEAGEDYESDWKLYPLIDCVLNPIHKSSDVHHESNIVKQFLAKLPPLPPNHRRQRRPLTFEAATNDLGIIKQKENGYCKQLSHTLIPPQFMSNPYKRTYNSITSTSSPRNNYRPAASIHQHSRISNGRIDFKLRSFKIPRLEDLKLDNIRLAERRDLAMRNLYIQEREVMMLETLVQGLQCGGK